MKNFITTATPMRISLVGGGSDLKHFYKKNGGGAVISAAINKYVYIIINKYHDKNKCLLKYSKTELVNNLTDIKHPLIKSCLKKIKLWGLDINAVADIPAGTGLGSSSSFTVGLINALRYYKKISLNKTSLAEYACSVEIDLLKMPIGKQDQYAASFGGLNLIKFKPNESTSVEQIKQKGITSFLRKNLLIINTGVRKNNKIILKDQIKNIKNDKMAIEHLKFMRDSVYEFKSSLLRYDIKKCGEILHENWIRKKSLAKGISNHSIDEMYSDSLKSGALGGKILGAGGRGYLMLICNKNSQKKIIKKFKRFEFLDFNFDILGSRKLY
tara:strand:- start:133 stop:1113 length:981 start_codon:yes stop_codon:yes gene_type:complete